MIFFSIGLVHSRQVYLQSLAKTVAALGAITHCSAQVIADWNCSLCRQYPLEQTQQFQNVMTNTSGFVGVSKQLSTLFLIFRGTEPDSKVNWFQDLTFQMVKYGWCNGCKVHAGFYQAYNWLRFSFPTLVTQRLNADPSIRNLVIGGRSMGAAFATLAAAEQGFKRTNNTYLITMGSPRVGNKEFTEYVLKYVNASFRLTHNKDPVPHLPPKGNYIHIGQEIFYGEDMSSFRQCQDEQEEDKNCSLSVKDAFSVKDHLNYFYEGKCPTEIKID